MLRIGSYVKFGQVVLGTFGTDVLRKQCEVVISKRTKVKFLGVPKEFVGTEVIQDLENRICELKTPKYWRVLLLSSIVYY